MSVAGGILFALLAAVAPPRFADLCESLARDPANGDERVHRFISRAGGTPLVEGRTAIFLVEADPGAPPGISGDFNGWGKGDTRVERLGSTRFFFRRVELLPAARVEYLIQSSERETPDPLNPRQVDGFLGPRSEVRMPGYAPVVAPGEDAGLPRGKLVSFDHASKILGNTRRVYVYLPPGYDQDERRRYPEVWLGDGTVYVEQLRTPELLDRLIAGGAIEPVVAILVDPVDRGVEYVLHSGFRRMMVEELVPRIVREYRVEDRPQRRLAAGGSRGGQAAIDLCLSAPATFGLCGAWAPAIAPQPAEEFIAGRRTTGRFVLLRALYDDRFGLDAPALRDGLTALGARVDYQEAPQGHNLATWPDLMALALIKAFRRPDR